MILFNIEVDKGSIHSITLADIFRGEIEGKGDIVKVSPLDILTEAESSLDVNSLLFKIICKDREELREGGLSIFLEVTIVVVNCFSKSGAVVSAQSQDIVVISSHNIDREGVETVKEGFVP